MRKIDEIDDEIDGLAKTRDAALARRAQHEQQFDSAAPSAAYHEQAAQAAFAAFVALIDDGLAYDAAQQRLDAALQAEYTHMCAMQAHTETEGEPQV